MAEWLYEAGIGEERAILIDSSRIVAARVCWGEPVRAGLVAEARLIAKPRGERRGLARLDLGSEVLVDALRPSLNEGDALRVRIVRPALAERGRAKLALARVTAQEPRPAPTLRERLEEFAARPVRISGPDFADLGWDELIDEAVTGEVAFPGGSLVIAETPAMTLIDVDGHLPPAELALAAVRPIALTVERLDLGGSVGIDFPTVAEKSDRQAVHAAFGKALRDWRGERTAMNGFGFVQLVSRRERPSLVARYAHRGEAGARILLRRAERVSEPGALELIANPATRRAVRPEWEAELARRTGRSIRWREDPTLALTAGFAQAVPA